MCFHVHKVVGPFVCWLILLCVRIGRVCESCTDSSRPLASDCPQTKHTFRQEHRRHCSLLGVAIHLQHPFLSNGRSILSPVWRLLNCNSELTLGKPLQFGRGFTFYLDEDMT